MSSESNVTVAVITYNSEKTILETLDSILHQSFPANRIELIISDDSSNDKTLELVNEWVCNNGLAFDNVKLLTSERNVGVTRNFNRAMRAARCGWIKPIAGDDLLLPHCLDSNVKYVSKAEGDYFLFSRTNNFKVLSSGEKIAVSSSPSERFIKLFTLSPQEQYKKLLIENFAPAPSCFLNNNAIRRASYGDESIPMLEDFPLWIRATRADIPLRYFNECTVSYRLGNSLSLSNESLFNLEYQKSLDQAFEIYVYPEIIKRPTTYLRVRASTLMEKFICWVFKNKSTLFSKILVRVARLIKPRHS